MAEDYTLTTPITKPAETTVTFKVTLLYFDWQDPEIRVRLRGSQGDIVWTGYAGPHAPAERDKALSMMRTLNTANLTTRSLHKRVLEQLEADGKIPSGDVTGTPDAPAELTE